MQQLTSIGGVALTDAIKSSRQSPLNHFDTIFLAIETIFARASTPMGLRARYCTSERKLTAMCPGIYA